MFLPANTTYFSAIPSSNVTVDAQYPSNIATIGPANGFISGMWLNRDAAANNAAVLIHGATTVGGRYVAYANNPFSRYDAEREWPLIAQAAFWTDLTDQGDIAFAITAAAGANGTITPSGAKMVAVGNDEAYTIKPNAGYHVADVLVDGASIGAKTTYTFNNVAEAHKISASFAWTPVPWNVVLTLSKSSVKSGHKVKFSGSVATTLKAAGTGTVTLQRKKGNGTWGNWKTVKLNSKGKYSITIKMSKKGTWYFRTKMAAGSGQLVGYSPSKKLKVH